MEARSGPRWNGLALAALGVAVPLGGCTDGESPSPDPAGETVELVASLPPLSHGDGVFELWISFALGRSSGVPALRHSTAVSAGRFRVDLRGQVVGEDDGPVTFRIDPSSEFVPREDDGSVAWQLALDAFITIEPLPDPAPDDPNLAGIVGGSFLNGYASLTIDYADALHRDFSAVAGSYHLATPTTSSTGDEARGVWFALPGGGAPSLVLPAPPAGWTYEGWISLGFFGSVSLGRFVSVSGPDFDGAGPYQGPLPGHPFPGSDFPTGATDIDLGPGNIFITLEPPADADGGGRPGFLTLLAAQLAESQPPGESVTMGPVTSFPAASVTLPIAP